jgi:hypothetical protein
MRNLPGLPVSWLRLEYKPPTITLHYPVLLERHYIKGRKQELQEDRQIEEHLHKISGIK